MHEINNVRQAEMHTAEPSEPQPRTSEVEIAVENMGR
jgi:hypothetical protein